MSNHHGGHRRRNYRGADDYDNRREVYDTPEKKLRRTIITLGEVDPIEEIPKVSKEIRANAVLGIRAIAENLWISVTEQPFKIPYYAALLRDLYEASEESTTDASGSSLGQQVLEEFWRGFQAFLDGLAWREIRLCIHFFAHLTVANIVTPQSMFELLKSFTAVLEELNLANSRARNAAFCAAEGLMIAGPVIKEDSSRVSEIIDSITAYTESISKSKLLVQPIVKLYGDSTAIENADELLDSALTVLKALQASDFAETTNTFPQPYSRYPAISEPRFELRSILVAPDVDDLPAETNDDARVEKEQWPQYYVRLFDNDVTPDPTTPVGYALRSGLIDLIDVFEVNRKECARLLLEFPKWTLPGTFKPTPGAPPQEPVPGKDWQLESTVIETILGSVFLLPESQHRSIYYIALITELCKLSPPTAGPAVGKSIRKLYALLADGLDVEVSHRLADWFSVHMSNFNFAWVWKEWIPDLSLSVHHPKRVFMRRVVEFEIRLSYYDRILKTLPEPMQGADAAVMPMEAPGPDYEYDDPGKPHHEAAQTVLNLLRGRTKAEDVIELLGTLKNSLAESAEGEVNTDCVIRSIAVQSLLHIGSRSFSHFLNAIERYISLLRNLASGGISSTGGGSNTEARMDILSAVASFWKRSKHMVVIVFDKLMQYQIVDPTDVVSWTFTRGGLHSATAAQFVFDAFQWDILKGALEKANGRVMVARRRVTQLRKEADDNAAATMASMDVDTAAQPDTIPAVESPALTTALRAFETLSREQKAAIVRTVECFVEGLASASHPNAKASEVATERAWHNRANWSEAEWEAWETWCWYRHFSRAFAPYLRNYTQTLEALCLSKTGPSDPAVDLFKKTWNITIGQEV
ncbi:MIF4G like-domain-containing protein [Sparassis latifolia]|uniref:Nuclear cap-binding protein subunit 1 n=1 Tax=Sparassis crispa TaxID=139825 RepID=A0A401GAD7_9APHY|nr:hypothetical protein SCP_0203060 [Sparassis crispa]GBE79109.1 hypothetical protein SCP_0203060 [Sparassis crispa]